ncbi:MAG: hypothetical protein KatS3mg011_0313 [Acidimicrobiia bacterium]|nr:MAG: hypothetical protein KatS3mg011_0313 [Acidimicrobiia bacterium]
MARQVRARFDHVLQAEQEAWAVSVERSTSLRDRMIQAEDRGARVRLQLVGGDWVEGLVRAASADHLVLTARGEERWVMLEAILQVVYRP